MSNPLELTWYECLECGDTRCYIIEDDKRFTDAELAAEHWRAKWTGVMAEKHGGLSDVNRAKIATIERFYALPSYDEDQP